MKGKCDRITKVDDRSLQERLWQVYLAELGPTIVDQTAFPQQCFENFEIFVKVLLDSDFDKFVLFSENEDVIGLAISSNNLEKVGTIAGVRFNPEMYKQFFPELCERGGLYYFPAMCILAEYQDENYFSVLADSMITMVNQNEGAAAFDYSEKKNPNMGGLLVYIAKKLNLRPNAEATIIDQQTFVVVQ